MLYQFEHFFADDEKHIQNPTETESRAGDNNSGRNFDERSPVHVFLNEEARHFR